jgi:tRNA/rRNA methyltransferase
MSALNNFAFVLVSPKSSGNVGAAARALKNMGFADLRIVAPRDYDPRDAASNVRASSATSARRWRIARSASGPPAAAARIAARRAPCAKRRRA